MNTITNYTNLDSSVSYRIRRTARLLRQNLFLFFQKNDGNVSPEHWIILSRLVENNGLSQTELADSTLHDNANVGRLIDTLENRGWVERRKHPHDRRKHSLFLTRDGYDLVARLTPAVMTERDDIVSGISENELQTFISVLQRIEQNLENKIEMLRDNSDHNG